MERARPANRAVLPIGGDSSISSADAVSPHRPQRVKAGDDWHGATTASSPWEAASPAWCGTLLVMATITAGSKGSDDAGRIAGIAASTVVVFWIAHVYAHGLAESIERGRRLDWHEPAEIAHRELSMPLAAVLLVAALVLAAVGVRVPARRVARARDRARDARRSGVRYAQVEDWAGSVPSRSSRSTSLGLLIVALKALVAH